MGELKYIRGMKYQVAEGLLIRTPVVGHFIEDKFFTLFPCGTLEIREGYAWDGASGPTFDSKSSMGPSLAHDVFCQLMRDGRLSYDRWQDTVNEFFHSQCIDAGMMGWRAGIWHFGVEFGDAGNPDQGPDREVKTAPYPGAERLV